MRTARLNVPGVTYHLIWRFVDRRWFFTDEHERHMYLWFLGRALAASDWLCFAYAIMSNHIHLAVVAGQESLGAWSKRVNSPFARWMNLRHDRLGPVFADRARDYAIRGPNEAALVAYIHNNPVRAGVVGHARDSTWTSHRAYLGLQAAQSWLRVEEGLRRIGQEATTLDAWIAVTPGESGAVEVAEMRREAHARGAIELATPRGGRPAWFPLVRRPHASVRIDPRWVLSIAADAVGMTVSEISSKARTRTHSLARSVFVQCGLALGLSHSDMAAALAVSHTAVTKARRRRLTDAGERAVSTALARCEVELSGVGFEPALATE
jgi:hypothetical protein